MDKKFLFMLVALVLCVACTVGVTLAWLSTASGEVVNTFTVGNIEIDLNETDVDSDDDTKKNSYKVVPGATVTKDPTVTVKKNSENCWVYVKVVNNLVIDGENVATYTPNSDWTLIGTKNEAGVVTNLYRYNSIVTLNASEDQKLTPVFNTVTYEKDIVIEEIEQLDNKTITAQAYAHQSDTVEESVANATAIAWAEVTAVSGN